jgi:hypothetical protein
MTALLDHPVAKSESATETRNWREFFHNWPVGVPQRGVLITLLNEQIPFQAFVSSQDMLLIERPAPDAVGARRVLLPSSQIAGMKFTDVWDAKLFRAVGFRQTAATDKRKVEAE